MRVLINHLFFFNFFLAPPSEHIHRKIYIQGVSRNMSIQRRPEGRLWSLKQLEVFIRQPPFYECMILEKKNQKSERNSTYLRAVILKACHILEISRLRTFCCIYFKNCISKIRFTKFTNYFKNQIDGLKLSCFVGHPVLCMTMDYYSL